LDNCKNQFIHFFPEFARQNKSRVKLPGGFDIKQFADGLFFNNGKNFVLERLRILYGN
jgi:hypothetical protein